MRNTAFESTSIPKLYYTTNPCEFNGSDGVLIVVIRLWNNAHEKHAAMLGLKPWPNGLASRHKFAKPELAMGGQTDSLASKSARKFTQVAKKL